MATIFCNCCLLLVSFLIIISNGGINPKLKITQSKDPIEFIHKAFAKILTIKEVYQ